MKEIKIKSALISVFNKDGLEPLIKELDSQGVIIYSTGGTQKFINDLENKILHDANLYKHTWFSQKSINSISSESKKKLINSKSIKFIPIIKEINKEITSTMDDVDNIDKCNDGLIKIDDEIILYKSKTATTFEGCVRGFSGICELSKEGSPEEVVFEETKSARHSKDSEIKNLSILFLQEFLKKIKAFIQEWDGDGG